MAADTAYAMSVPPPAYVQQAVAEGPSWPIFGHVSSGRLLPIECFDQRAPYRGYLVVHVENLARTSFDAVNNCSGPMQKIRQGFGRTFSRLPMVFGVSRQTLYNWLDGDMPKERHQARILQLAEAAQTFSESSFTPSAASLTRTLSRGKSFLELMSEGADGRDAAQKLITLTQRSLSSRARLNAALAGVGPTHPANQGFGAPALDEDAS